MIGGAFDTVDALDHAYLVRLVGNPPPPTGQILKAEIECAVEITWDTELNAHYQVQWATDANAATWKNLGLPLIGTGQPLSVFDHAQNPVHKYYRIRQY